MADPKTLSETFAGLMKAAEPMMERLSKQADEAARVGHEQYKKRTEEFDREWDEFDKEFSRRWKRT
jgi:hypothetical protein